MKMNKRKLSVLFLVIYLAVMVLSLSGCGDNSSQRGLAVDSVVIDRNYNDESGLTSLSVSVTASNENDSHVMRSYKFRLVFKDMTGAVITSKVYTQYEGLAPYSSESFTYYFSEQSGTAIRGEVIRVEAVPVEMTLDNEEIEASGSNGSTEWSFWTWFWVIVSGILIFLFITCCIGAEGDSDAIIGGVVIFLAPAILILVVYFGFFFGH